jgi:Uncharacterised nucleotidyltransferase
MGDEPPIGPIVDTLKRSVAALRDAEVPYLLGGSLACWARGGPRPENDLDLMVRPEDAKRAQDALVAAGMRAEDPPEEWLLKAWDGDVLVDLIFGPTGVPLDEETFARGDDIAVMSVTTRVMALNDVLVSKLLALDEHCLDYEDLLRIARALREQVDWDELRERTAASPFAKAFFTMVEELGVAPAPGAVPP